MKIQDVGRKHPPFDKAAGEAEYMLATGHFVAVDQPKVRPTGKFVYGILPDDAFQPPAITYSCQVCTLKGCFGNSSGTAHKVRHFHCGHEDFCDAVTAETYVRLFKDWKRRQENCQQEPTQPTPKRVWFAGATQ